MTSSSISASANRSRPISRKCIIHHLYEGQRNVVLHQPLSRCIRTQELFKVIYGYKFTYNFCDLKRLSRSFKVIHIQNRKQPESSSRKDNVYILSSDQWKLLKLLSITFLNNRERRAVSLLQRETGHL